MRYINLRFTYVRTYFTVKKLAFELIWQ